MLSADEANDIEDRATARAKKLSDEVLMKELIYLETQHRAAPIADDRIGFGIMARVFRLELGIREPISAPQADLE